MHVIAVLNYMQTKSKREVMKNREVEKYIRIYVMYKWHILVW